MQTSILVLAAASLLASGSVAVDGSHPTYGFSLYSALDCAGSLTDKQAGEQSTACLPFPADAVSIEVTDADCFYGQGFGVWTYAEDGCNGDVVRTWYDDGCDTLNFTALAKPKSYTAGCICNWEDC